MAQEEYHVDNENGAEMDYPEHEATYELFLSMSKWVVLFNVALLVAMAVGFFMGGGMVGGFLTFIVLMIAAKIIA